MTTVDRQVSDELINIRAAIYTVARLAHADYEETNLAAVLQLARTFLGLLYNLDPDPAAIETELKHMLEQELGYRIPGALLPDAEWISSQAHRYIPSEQLLAASKAMLIQAGVTKGYVRRWLLGTGGDATDSSVEAAIALYQQQYAMGRRRVVGRLRGVVGRPRGVVGPAA